MSERRQAEVIVIGAGAAGLACARSLIQQGVDVLLLEARARIGGRVHTQIIGGEAPIELGAEYFHGMTPVLKELIREFSLPFYDVLDEHLLLKRGRLKEWPDFFFDIEKAIGKMPKRSRPVADYLQRSFLGSEMRSALVAFIEGFHAADLEILGTGELREAMEIGEIDLNGSQMFRPLCGYSHLLNRMAESLHEVLQLETVVKDIDWSEGRVEIQARQRGGIRNYRCSRVVITIPLGVLKAPPGADSAVRLKPQPEDLQEILQSMEMGHVQRMTFTFNERFWERLRPGPVSFMHAGPEFYFPTWWTQMPVRSANLTCWQGGPKAQEMSNWSEEERVEVALKTLSTLTRFSVRQLRGWLQAVWAHDWSRDPFTRGAYSYIRRDGLEISRGLTQPVGDTIYFAGEAASQGGNRGTGHGALASGQNVAQKMIRKMNKGSSRIPAAS